MRKLHKALLRWHDPENWPLIREALQQMGRADLIGNGPNCLVPRHQPGVPLGAPARSSPSAVPRSERNAPRVGGKHGLAGKQGPASPAARPAAPGRCNAGSHPRARPPRPAKGRA